MKNAFSLALALMLPVLLYAQEGGGNTCIDPALIDPDGTCITLSDPVCGCDGVTYSNSCFADIAGVTSYTFGPCGTVFGCTVFTACNFNPQANWDDGSCFFPGDSCDDNNPMTVGDMILADCSCGGTVQIIAGCTDPIACNFNPQANTSDNSCEYPPFGLDCNGDCNLDFNGNGLCDLNEIVGCTYPEALNYQPTATLDNGSCLFACDGDFNGDGSISASDLLAFLAVFGSDCEPEAQLCTLTNPAPHANGLLCTSLEPQALVIVLNDATLRYVLTEGTLTYTSPTTLAVSATFTEISNPGAGWVLNAAFTDGMNWNAWSTQGFPTSYRDDCNLVGDNYLDWSYFLLSPTSTLIGTGSNEGQQLNLAHAPANLFYGAQLGLGASNVNSAFGLSTWFFIPGNNNFITGSLYFDVNCQ